MCILLKLNLSHDNNETCLGPRMTIGRVLGGSFLSQLYLNYINQFSSHPIKKFKRTCIFLLSLIFF